MNARPPRWLPGHLALCLALGLPCAAAQDRPAPEQIAVLKEAMTPERIALMKSVMVEAQILGALEKEVLLMARGDDPEAPVEPGRLGQAVGIIRRHVSETDPSPGNSAGAQRIQGLLDVLAEAYAAEGMAPAEAEGELREVAELVVGILWRRHCGEPGSASEQECQAGAQTAGAGGTPPR